MQNYGIKMSLCSLNQSDKNASYLILENSSGCDVTI